MLTYSPSVMLVWQVAMLETLHAQFQFIGIEQLLVGVLKVGDLLAMEQDRPGSSGISRDDLELLRSELEAVDATLQDLDLNKVRLRRRIRAMLGKGDHLHEEKIVHRNDECRLAFKRAEKEATGNDESTVKLIHLLTAILDSPGNVISGVLAYYRQKRGSETPKNPNSKRPIIEHAVRGEAAEPTARTRRPTFLDRYGVDLTRLAREGKIEPLIGRKDELLKVIRALTRKSKNNPLLIGDAGVGKTAIVRGLALHIAQGSIPEELKDKRIIELSLANLVAGTKYRGEFEEKLTGVIDECKKDNGIVVFIDEIHTLVGAGGASGALDAANILKPALSKGEIRCIGATTTEEYRKSIEKDPALERRFQAITVEEPDEHETICILEGLCASYEKHHGVKINPDTLRAVVGLTVRYMPDRRLPDKAIDVLDEACSRVNIDPAFNGSSGSPSPEEVTTSVTDEVIARVIADWTKRPIEKIGAAEKARLSRMEEELRKRVIGQDDAVSRVAKAIKMSRAGLRDPKKTIGVFLFLGPTGVGKTELAKSLAEFLFDSDTAMIRFDMSEYMEKHSVSKFIGSPPGYVGHEDEGQLTGKLRRRPYSLVLLDEIEKAHPDVLDLFLQVFDEGRITDSKGREIDARNAIFIMTSNIGTNLRKAAAPGFGRSEEDAAEEKVSMELKKRLRPEFLNRIDEIIRFNSLDIEDIEKIARLMIEGLRSRAGSQGIDVYIADPVITYIARNGYDPAFGARPLSRLIDDEIGIPLSELIISKRFDPHGSVIIEMGNSGPTFEVVMKNI